MKRIDSIEPDYYKYTEEELLDILADVVQFGWIERKLQSHNKNTEQSIKDSVDIFNKLKKGILGSISSKKSLRERLLDKESLFRPILLSYRDVSEIMGFTDMNKMINEILKEYVITFKTNDDIVLGDIIDVGKLRVLLDMIEKILLNKLEEVRLETNSML